MNDFTKEELHLIQRALICMSGVVAAMDGKQDYRKISELGDKVRSHLRVMDIMGEEDENYCRD